jgi:hypothetical protein
MNISQQVIILSAESDKKTPEQNNATTRILKHCLEDCNMLFGEAMGMYKGTSENSFVVVIQDIEEIKILKDFAFKNFNQESIIYQDANQEAYLINNNGTHEQLGELAEVSEIDAINLDSYTLFGGRYYSAKKR